MEYALVRSRPTAEGARWSFTSGNLARGTAPAKDVHLRASVMQASVLPSDTSASRIFAMGCNKRGFRPERLELSLSLPPSSRPACGVLTIDTSGAAQVRTGARPLVPPASAPPPLPVPETGHPLGWVGFQPRCSRLTAGTTGLSPTATDAAGNVNTRNLRSS
jgi:hypothetical protein